MDIIRDELEKLYAICEFSVNVHRNANHTFDEAEKTVIYYQGMYSGYMLLLSRLLPPNIYDDYVSYTDDQNEKMYALLATFERKE